jgi:hypothetical protein
MPFDELLVIGGGRPWCVGRSASEASETMKDDQFYRNGILHQEWIKRWTIYIDERS